MNNSYYNFKNNVDDAPNLVTLDQIQKMKLDKTKNWYISVFRYNDNHKKIEKERKSVKGIRDTVTDVLLWDFDSTDLEVSRQQALELCHRLVNNYDVDPDNISCYFSGSKGFHVVVPLDREITPTQFRQAVMKIGGDLHLDPTVTHANCLIRLEHTVNQKTGLYKIPLTAWEMDELTIDQIKDMAKEPREDFEHQPKAVSLPESLFKVKEKEKNELTLVTNEKFDPKSTPKGWKIYKWALAEGWFDSGERHQALMVIAATCRGLGYPKEQAYYICKAALKKQSARTGQDEFDKEELWNNIIEDSVYSDGWEGGQYSPETNPWLKKYCERMGFETTSDKEEPPAVDLDILINQFIDYSTNFEQNIIKTGIPGLDENVIFSTSTLNGILGQPGSGKTTIAIEYLKNASLNGVPSMFFSLDMGPPLVFSKLVQKETGVGFKDALRIYREDVNKREEVSKILKEKYKNVGMNFRCGVTVADIRNAINVQTERTGVKPKLIIVDYLENIAGPYSDPTANAGMITNQLKDMATELEVCVILLLQTQKHSTPDISDPLLSMKQIKGSSAIEQNCSVVLTLWREGYSPNTTDDDNYISFALVKNRFGSLGRWDFHWNPVRGHIRTLTEEEREEFNSFKIKKKQQRAAEQAEAKDWQ